MMDSLMPENDYSKRQKAMAARLAAMPKDNPIIKRASVKMKQETTGQDAWKKFEIVDTLVSAARTEYTNGSDFNTVIHDLADALESTIDKGNKKDDTDD